MVKRFLLPYKHKRVSPKSVKKKTERKTIPLYEIDKERIQTLKQINFTYNVLRLLLSYNFTK